MKKIIDENFVKKKLKYFKDKGKIIGLCHGVFDLLHIGHINHISEAKKKCDILIVSVTHDDFINKGPGRPAFNHNIRMQSVASLESVDYVYLSNNLTAKKSIGLIKPNFYFKGPDYKNLSQDTTGEIKNEITELKKNKGNIYITKSKKFSSSNLINKYMGILSESQRKVIKRIKEKYTLNEIKIMIKNLEKLKPIVIGETIIDQYIFSEAMGKSGKEPVLVLRQLEQKKYLGGAAAVCNNISDFCKKINFLSMIGQKSEELNFIKNKLSKNVKFYFHKKKKSPTIIKKRFIDKISKSKVLGVYDIQDSPINIHDEENIKRKLNKLLRGTSLTIISDYGHGFLSKNFVNEIIKKSKFVAANAQINAANISFHSLRNYKNIDFLIINENEIRHEMRSKSDKLKELIKNLAKNQKIKYVAVTRGILGSIFYDNKNNKFYETDAFEKNVKDKIGAGDAMLSISSLCLASKIDFELSMLISSLCAAQNVKIYANERPIEKKNLIKDLEHLFS